MSMKLNYQSEVVSNKGNEYHELEQRLENFLEWYEHVFISKSCDEYHRKIFVNNVRNFIEKMAVWYELRYPRNLTSDINREIFEQNTYIQSFENSSQFDGLEWSKFYNFEVFYHTLSDFEKRFLEAPKFPSIVVFSMNGELMKLEVRNDGCINRCSDNLMAFLYDEDKNKDEVGDMYFEDFIEMLDDYIRQDGELKNNCFNIDYFDMLRLRRLCSRFRAEKYFKEELLNCVMYRIIERGKEIDGVRRGLLFAEEFNRDINIPMMYVKNNNDNAYHLGNFVEDKKQIGNKASLAKKKSL